MRYIIELLASELAHHIEVVVYRPNTAGGLERGAENPRLTLIQFEASRYRPLRGLAHYSLRRQYCEVVRLRALRPDLIHVFNGEEYLLPALALRMMPDVPMLVTVHDPVLHPGEHVGRLTTGIMRRLLYRRAAAIHILAEVFGKVLSAHGVPRDRVYVTRLGSLAGVFTRYDTSSTRCENAALLFGQLKRYKGIDVLVEAGLALAARGKPRRIIIAGPGRIPHRLRAMILAHPEIFELHNYYLPDNEAAILLKRSSTCVLPYHQATQSCLPPIADAYGHRIIATRSGSFIEEIPRLGGMLVTPGSVEELARALEEDQESRSPPTPSPEIYAWPAIANSLVEAYAETIERFCRAPARNPPPANAEKVESA